jgi:hypothetical protein
MDKFTICEIPTFTLVFQKSQVETFQLIRICVRIIRIRIRKAKHSRTEYIQIRNTVLNHAKCGGTLGAYVKYGVRFLKFIFAPCAQLYIG